MNDPFPTFILAVPGTQETKELPRQAVLEGIQRGEILPDNWVWSPTHNDWKPLAEIPELQVAPPVTPPLVSTPVPVAMSAPSPQIAEQAAVPVRPFAVTPRTVANAPALTETQKLARTTYSQPMEIKHEFPYFKVFFAVAFLAVAGLLGANYYLIEQPFSENLATTSFASVPAYAHLGAFTQPGALVIHIPPANGLNEDNFADYLIALAKSTPPRPLTQTPTPFEIVGLTSSWQSQLIFTGPDWQKLAQMGNSSSDDKKLFELEHLAQLTGSPLLYVRKGEDPAAATEAAAKAWKSLVANFVPKTP
jgi:hypothetical protein